MSVALAGTIAICIILLLLLRAPFAGGQSSKATSEAFTMEKILSENGCGAFAGLVAATAAAGEAFRAKIAGDGGGAGMTIICPDDEAVAAFGTGRFRNLTAGDQVTLLLYHGVATACFEEARTALGGEVATLASGRGGCHVLLVRDYQGTVILSSPRNEARVTKIVVHSDRLVVYLIDAVLVPGEPADWASLLISGIGIGLEAIFVLLVCGLVLLVHRRKRSGKDSAATDVSDTRTAPRE